MPDAPGCAYKVWLRARTPAGGPMHCKVEASCFIPLCPPNWHATKTIGATTFTSGRVYCSSAEVPSTVQRNLCSVVWLTDYLEHLCRPGHAARGRAAQTPPRIRAGAASFACALGDVLPQHRRFLSKPHGFTNAHNAAEGHGGASWNMTLAPMVP